MLVMLVMGLLHVLAHGQSGQHVQQRADYNDGEVDVEIEHEERRPHKRAEAKSVKGAPVWPHQHSNGGLMRAEGVWQARTEEQIV